MFQYKHTENDNKHKNTKSAYLEFISAVQSFFYTEIVLVSLWWLYLALPKMNSQLVKVNPLH